MAEVTTQQALEFDLKHDAEKSLKDGKRRYKDTDGHMLYFTQSQVQQMGSPDSISVRVQPHQVGNNKT